jgi:hypothetical protein
MSQAWRIQGQGPTTFALDEFFSGQWVSAGVYASRKEAKSIMKQIIADRAAAAAAAADQAPQFFDAAGNPV